MSAALLNPARALAVVPLVVSAFAVIATAPASAGGPQPTTTTQQGTLVQVVSDDFARGKAGYAYGLRKADRSFVTVDGLAPAEAKRLVGREVRVTGKSVGKARLDATSVAAADSPTPDSTTAMAGEIAEAAAGYRKVAVVLVNFADNPVQPVTADSMRSTMFTGVQSVNAYYQDTSDGALGVSGDVLGWHTVNRTSTTSCDYSAWGNAAANAATAAGANLTAYDHVMYFWPWQESCGWAGLGELPGKNTWINGNTSLRVLSHELGHNLGEHHASAEKCHESGVPTPFPSPAASCSVSEYGDPFTVMGSASTYLHSNAARGHLGFMAPVTTTVGQATTQVLAPADSGSGVRMLRVPRGDGSYLTLEFRRPTGLFDTFTLGEPVVTGVTIRIDWGTGRRQTMLVDTTPTTATYSDAPLLAGRAVKDPVSGATIRVASVSSSGADVSVSYAGSESSDTTAPSAVGQLTGSVTQTPMALTTWSPATDASGVAAYRVWRDGTLLGETSATSYYDSEITRGTSYTYSVAAIDTWGNVGPASTVAISVPTVDTTKPTRVRSPKVRVSNRKNQVSLTWAAAADDTGVTKYVIKRTGRRPAVRAVTATSLRDRPGRGRATYTILARDAAGNTSAPVTLTVRVR